MGKGEIISETGNGYYLVEIKYGGRDVLNSRVSYLQDQITVYQNKLPDLSGQEYDIALAQIAAMEKEIETIQSQFPDDFQKNLWCVDLTEGLTGDIGTIEVPAEIIYPVNTRAVINIQPGYDGDAAYDADRDKEIVPIQGQTAAQAFFNRAVLPGVQKWMPRFRIGTIIADSLDFGADTCSICLDPTYSSRQNLDVNKDQGFNDCIENPPPSGFIQFCVDNPTHPT